MPRKKATDDRLARRAEICNTVSGAMKDLSAKKQMDWSRENPEILLAQNGLDEAMIGFIEGSTTREEVKQAYKSYADLHIVIES